MTSKHHHSSSSKGRASEKKRLFFLIGGIVLLCLSIVIVCCGIHVWEQSQSAATVAALQSQSDAEADSTEASMLTYNGGAYTLKDNLEVTLVMGLDKTEANLEDNSDANRNEEQADFLVLIVTDKDAKTSRMLQLNRDTMAEVTELGLFGDNIGTVTEQLCLAHTYGNGNRDSDENVVEAVEGVLDGIHIDHYISVTMDAVSIINDDVGGVPVTITDDFSDTDPSLVEGETITLTGTQALEYVRSRSTMEDTTNLARMSRQQTYMEALYAKLQDLYNSGDDTTIASLLSDVSQYMVSDCSLNTLSTVLNDAMEYSSGQIETIDGTAKEGEDYMEFYLDSDSLQQEVLSLFYEQTGTDTSLAEDTDSAIVTTAQTASD